MKRKLGVALLLAPCLCVGGVALAQGAPASSQPGKTKPLSYVLTTIKRDCGASVVTTTALAGTQVKPPKEAVTAETLEASLTELVKSMPPGTIWAKLMLPLPAGGRQFRGDDLVDYALAQSRLYPGIGSSQPGIVEVLGQKLPAEKADAVVAALGLKPVYVLCNPNKVASGGDFDSLSDDQKKNLVDKQVHKLLSLPPEQQAQELGQMFQQAAMVFGNLIQNMSPEQRRGFMQNLGPMMGNLMQSMGGPSVFFGMERPPIRR
jgi:hypothetical protein